jgi:hypothetical protein
MPLTVIAAKCYKDEPLRRATAASGSLLHAAAGHADSDAAKRKLLVCRGSVFGTPALQRDEISSLLRAIRGGA